NNIAQIHRMDRRFVEAEPLYRQALALWEKTLGPQHPDIALGYRNLGDLFRDEGKLDGAVKLDLRALNIAREGPGEDPMVTADILSNLVQVHVEQGRYTEAERLERHVLAILEKQRGASSDEYRRNLQLHQQLLKINRREPATRRADAFVEQ